MFLTVQDQFLSEFKCLCLTDSHTTAYGLQIIQENNSIYQDSTFEESFVNSPRKSPTPIHVTTSEEDNTGYDGVLQRCKQTEPLPFQDCYTDSVLQNCFKIGEGVYGEVFLFKNEYGGSSVMKVIPIEGSRLVNGDRQKQFHEILSEIEIATELSNLRNNPINKTFGFNEAKKIRCVRGQYPARLLELWELYQESHGSENESPEMFGDDQLYIVLELAHGGNDMEAFVFKNAIQTLSLFKQLCFALAIAESALEFEHRDLHWGNVLISLTEKHKVITYVLNGKEFSLPSCGIEVSIIDFTLSRIKCNGIIRYNDISKDPDLFTATGDYQFDVYRMMKNENRNDWEYFEPYSNILWLHYILTKIVNSVKFSYRKSKSHRATMFTLHEFKSKILNYKSANELVINEFVS